MPSRIVAFGSSSVKGRGDPDRGGFVGRLSNWHTALNPSNLTFNLGLVGDSTSKMVGRLLHEAPNCKPDLVILYPGLNDCRRRTRSDKPVLTDDEFRKNLSALLEHSSALAPTILVSAFPIDESRTTPWAESKQFYLLADTTRFTDIGREVCQEAKVCYLPIYETWIKHADFAELSIDGLHGTPEAHELLFNELRELISDMFGLDSLSPK